MASPLIILTILTLVSPSFGQVTPPKGNLTLNTQAIKDTLTLDFYKKKCPNVEQIVNGVVKKSIQENPGFIPGLIRLHFHDCFITGCDASILLTPERYNNFASELAHPLNGATMRGMTVIDDVKAELEKQCPGVVSCADIIAFAARDAVVLAGNPHYTTPAGRRDGSNVNGLLPHDLPAGSQPVDTLLVKYAYRGLTAEDLVVLEAAHSVGQARCQDSLADFMSLANVSVPVGVIDKQFKAAIEQTYCPASKTKDFDSLFVPLNMVNNGSAWGASFFSNLVKGKGVIPADLAMSAHPSTRDYVRKYAADPVLWAQKFNEAMIKIGKINVITGNEGDIRKQCTVLNTVSL